MGVKGNEDESQVCLQSVCVCGQGTHSFHHGVSLPCSLTTVAAVQFGASSDGKRGF